jgi:hypothetical protein
LACGPAIHLPHRFIAVDRERLDSIFNDHTVVSIPVSPQNRADQARVLSPDYRSYVRGVH